MYVTTISDFFNFRSSRLRGFFLTSRNEGVRWHGGRSGCWADAAELPGFSIVEVLFIHIGGISWLCRTYPARHAEDDILLEMNRFE